MRSTEERFRSKYKIIVFVIILFFVGVESIIPARAQEKVIKVGYFDKCCVVQENTGEYSGYIVDYLDKIAEHTDWEYEYVFDTWENCIKRLESGEIQLICQACYSEELEDKFLYADVPLGYEYTVLYARDDSDIYFEDYQSMQGCKTGLVGESTYTEEFFAFAKANDLEYEPVYYKSEQEILTALRNGEVELAVVRSIHDCGDLKQVGRFEVKPFYCITGKNNAKLMNEINSVMQQIKIDYPEIEARLHQKYYGDSKISSGPLFTREEQAYIEAAEPIVVKMMLGTQPLAYEKNGEYTGIFVEYLNLISETSGLKFQLEETTSLDFDEQTKHILDENYVTLRAKRAIESIDLNEQLIISSPVVETKLAYVKRRDEMAKTGRMDYVFAITNEMNYLPPLLKEASDQYEIKYYDNIQQCLEAVYKKEADIAIQDSYVIRYWLQKPKFAEKLAECPGQDVVNGMCLVASEDQQMLIEIVNKTIQYISDEEKEQVAAVELLVNSYKNGVGDFLYDHWGYVTCIIIILIGAVYVYTVLLRRVTALQTRKKDYEKLQQRVQQDELTGVYNRTNFYKKVREMVDNTEESMCIVLMDISNFKVVNDLYGMETGDKLLKYMAKELKRLGEGKEFIISRFTGDHFYMCMKKEDFYQIPFPRRYKTFLEDIEITVAYGVFMVEDQRDIPVNIMCDRAKMAAHDKGRNRVEYIRHYSDEERKQMLHEQEVENDMERALEARQFSVYIQPKYDVRDAKIVGGEALVRWIHPSKGMVSPGEFISIFERNGFILRLDYYVWEETCKVLSELKKKGLGGKPVSINVSRAHFYGVDLQEKLQELIAKYQLSPEELELEITETICAEDPDIIYKKIRELQEAGFKVAMDDFGSGYSSLNMLKEMPLDIIKMDLKFLDGGDNEEKSRNILQTLITLAQSLKLSVVVEGVETKEQTEFLQRIGSFYAQGYYFSRPVDCKTYEEMLTKDKQGD